METTEGPRSTNARKWLVALSVAIALLAVRRLYRDQWDGVNLALLGGLAVAAVVRGPENMRMFVLSVVAALAACGLVLLGILALG